MSCWAIIPVKPSGEGKARLAGALEAEARSALVEAMIAHVLQTVASAPHVARTCLVGPARDGLPQGIDVIADPGGGLNAAVASGLVHARQGGATRLLVIAADLPRLCAMDIELLALASEGCVAIAADRHGVGTNALSLPLPEAEGFVFAFGEDSFARHHAEAARLGLPVEVIHSPGLERDIDVPEDLPDAACLSG